MHFRPFKLQEKITYILVMDENLGMILFISCSQFTALEKHVLSISLLIKDLSLSLGASFLWKKIKNTEDGH